MEGLDDLITEITEKYAKEANDRINLKSDLKNLIEQVTLNQIAKIQFILDREKSKLERR